MHGHSVVLERITILFFQKEHGFSFDTKGNRKISVTTFRYCHSEIAIIITCQMLFYVSLFISVVTEWEESKGNKMSYVLSLRVWDLITLPNLTELEVDENEE